MSHQPTAAGKSSFDLIDVNAFLTALNLNNNTVFLDLACGAGNYAIEIARQLQPKGTVHALDLWEEGISTLKQRAESQGLTNIDASVCDVSKKIPLDNNSLDVCLMATVLHDLIADGIHEATLDEIVRTLKPSGRLAVIEFKKISGPPGPPEKVRLSPEELDQILTPRGFQCQRTAGLGAVTYLSLFKKG